MMVITFVCCQLSVVATVGALNLESTLKDSKRSDPDNESFYQFLIDFVVGIPPATWCGTIASIIVMVFSCVSLIRYYTRVADRARFYRALSVEELRSHYEDSLALAYNRFYRDR